MEDIAATIYSALGIDWTKSIADTPSGRIFEYVPFGSVGTYVPVEEVFAATGLSDADRTAILGGTMCKLLKIPA